ncbi:hypothetical protein [Siminovitchia terrae]
MTRTVKLSEELNNQRVIEKFDIKPQYWVEAGIDWGSVT